MDRIQQKYFIVRDWVMVMPDTDYWAVLRLMLLITLPVVICGLFFRHGVRSTLVQIIGLTTGVLIALTLRFTSTPQQPDVKLWTLVFATVLLLLAPAILPFFLTRRYGTQKTIRNFLYAMLVLGLLLEIL